MKCWCWNIIDGLRGSTNHPLLSIISVVFSLKIVGEMAHHALKSVAM